MGVNWMWDSSHSWRPSEARGGMHGWWNPRILSLWIKRAHYTQCLACHWLAHFLFLFTSRKWRRTSRSEGMNVGKYWAGTEIKGFIINDYIGFYETNRACQQFIKAYRHSASMGRWTLSFQKNWNYRWIFLPMPFTTDGWMVAGHNRMRKCVERTQQNEVDLITLRLCLEIQLCFSALGMWAFSFITWLCICLLYHNSAAEFVYWEGIVACLAKNISFSQNRYSWGGKWDKLKVWTCHLDETNFCFFYK